MESLPLLTAMQSSPTEKWQPLMVTLQQLSGSRPSVFGETLGPSMLRHQKPRWLESTGWMFQLGELRTVMPAKAM